MPDGALYVGRPTRWGNPWHVGADGLVAGPGLYFTADPEMSRRMIVGLFTDWLRLGTNAPALMAGGPYKALEERRRTILDNLPDLAGRDLACWCPLEDTAGKPVPCHADVLLELANAEGITRDNPQH